MIKAVSEIRKSVPGCSRTPAKRPDRIDQVLTRLSFAPPFAASMILHFAALALMLALIHPRGFRPEDNPISVSLLEPAPDLRPQEEKEKHASVKIAPARPKRELALVQKSAPQPAKDESPKLDRPQLAPVLPPSNARDGSPNDGGGSAPSVNNFTTGDIHLVPGSGSTAGAGGTASAGLGSGSGAPGLPGTSPLRTNRPAKPIQTARASYPPMALRMGLESDVTLKIEVDPQGNVTKAEIVKSGGAGFDEEALKAVKQSRFEPAQINGQNVAAEFSYIYRFRLQR